MISLAHELFMSEYYTLTLTDGDAQLVGFELRLGYSVS